MDEPRDVLVLGAGLAGCALAYYLTLEGMRSIVYDPRAIGAGATGRAAGILTEQLWDPWDIGVVRESRREYAELAERSDPSAFRRSGFVRFAAGQEALELLDRAVERWTAWGVEVDELSSDDLSRIVPPLSGTGSPRGVLAPRGALVDPGALAASYADAARTAGTVFDFGRPMDRLSYGNGSWTLSTPSGTLRGRRLVVAAGAWTKAVLRSIGRSVPLAPYRTQAALVRPLGGPPGDVPAVHDLDRDVYLRPEKAGQLLFGDGTGEVEVDPERFDPEGDPAFLHHLRGAIAERFPAWSDPEIVRAWAGVCAATPDRLPIVGPVPEAEELYVLAGFNGLGVMRSGALAHRLARRIGGEEGDASESLGPARPERFHEMTPPFTPRPGFTVEGGERPKL